MRSAGLQQYPSSVQTYIASLLLSLLQQLLRFGAPICLHQVDDSLSQSRFLHVRQNCSRNGSVHGCLKSVSETVIVSFLDIVDESVIGNQAEIGVTPR